jgi:outer membrane protein OmpU
MKKIIALAVAGAFAAPVYAADISVGGSFEWAYKDVNGATSTDVDNTVSIKAAAEANNGISVAADINLTGNSTDNTNYNSADDGGSSITVSGEFGSIDLGDTSSAADAFNAPVEYHKVTGAGATTAPDAAILWTLPTMVEGLTVVVSNSPDSTGENGDAGAHTGMGLKYATGPVTVSYAYNDNDDGSKITTTNAVATFGGLSVAVENVEDDDEDGTATTARDERAVGVKYSMGDATIFAAQMETKVNNAVTADASSFGVHYNLGGGLTFLAETSTDDKNASLDTTAVGVVFAF